jgi:tRNA pseudouridine synthase 10
VKELLDEETLKYNISLLAQSPIRQRTPTRVAHRRADKIRKRSIHEIDSEVLSDGRAVVELTTDGGLYIKELLHGDEGRTEPSLSSLLGKKVNVEILDVTGVHYEDGENRPEGVVTHG